MSRWFLNTAITGEKEIQKKHQAQSLINKTWKEKIKKIVYKINEEPKKIWK